MKINKKIIAVLVFAVVLISTFAILTFSASAYVIDDVEYEFKLPTGKITTSHDPGGSYSKSAYITVSTDDWTLSGNGSFGYDHSIDTWYIQIDKYAGSNGSWLLKLDSDRYWKYRDGLDDYGTMHSTWHTMKTEPKDIYISFSGLLNNDDYHGQLFTRLSHTITFTGEGFTTFTENILPGETIRLPTITRDDYEFRGWRVVGDEYLYYPGDEVTPSSCATFEAVFSMIGHTVGIFDIQGEKGKIVYVNQHMPGSVFDLSRFDNAFTYPVINDSVYSKFMRHSGYKVYNFTTGEVKSLPLGSKITVDGEITIYLEWVYDAPDFVFYLGDNKNNLVNYEKIEYKDCDPAIDFVIPDYPADKMPLGKYFSHWVYLSEDYGNTYFPGNKMSALECEHVFIAVFGDALKYYFYDTFTAEEMIVKITLDDTTLLFPPNFTTHEGYKFVGWTDTVSIFYAGREYPISAIQGHDLFTVWVEEGSSGGGIIFPGGDDTGSDADGSGSNFIVSFFFDTYERTKSLVLPYFIDFQVPFINMSLADLVSMIYYGLIAWLVVVLVSKVIGAVK